MESAGEGICIEHLMNTKELEKQIKKSLQLISNRTKYKIRGYWATMDAVMQPKEAKKITLLKHAPYIRIRHNINIKKLGKLGKLIKSTAKKSGMKKVIADKRPYDNYVAGDIKKGITKILNNSKIQYAFTKSNFGLPAPRIDNGVTLVNYTTGQWDGWTPFYTINSLKDIKNSEKAIKGPGYIVGTIDSCLWTFSGNVWSKGEELKKIGDYLSTHKKIINVTPNVVARYAKILAKQKK